MTPTKPRLQSSAVGRRKTATASVRLTTGTGVITVNGKPAATYFPKLSAQKRYNTPFNVVSVTKYDVSAKVAGGGQNGQLDALTLGIARGLAEIKSEYKLALRTAGLLTRDSRKRQRRMVGTGGKARRQKQSPKR